MGLRRAVTASIEDGRAFERTGGNLAAQFGSVRCPAHRHDQALGMTAPVRRALGELLPPLRGVLASALGAGAELWELAAMVSDPGAAEQALHRDTRFAESDRGEAPVLVTIFVALQDVEPSMGPTFVLPCTHSEPAFRAAPALAAFHGAPLACADAKRKAGERVVAQRRAPLLRRGEALLFDSRLMHGGGPNRSRKR